MTFKNGYRLWDEEYERAHWTPAELAAGNARVASIGEIIEAERQGYITHDEAMIRHLILDPDLLYNMLEDADGDSEKTRLVYEWYEEARVRSLGLVAMA